MRLRAVCECGCEQDFAQCHLIPAWLLCPRCYNAVLVTVVEDPAKLKCADDGDDV